MPRTLTDRQQRFVFGGLVIVLVAFGIYLSIGGFGDDAETAGTEGAESADSASTEEGGAGADTPPSPIPTTATEDMEVLQWLPFEEDELKAAGATAQAFGEAYGTIDYTGEPQEYYASMEELAADDFASTLAQSSGANALWDEMSEQETVTQGRAAVQSIRSFDDRSVVFVVKVQSIVESSDGTDEDLGDFAITVQRSGGGWEVYDFQPADAGNFGGS